MDCSATRIVLAAALSGAAAACNGGSDDGSAGSSGDDAGTADDGTGGTIDGTGDPTGADESGDGPGGDPPPADVQDEPEITECGDHPLSGPSDGSCEVEGGGGGATLLRGTVLTPEGILRGGQVLVGTDGTIACVACDCGDAPGSDDATVVTCGSSVISPGLINPHDHITFANNSPIGEGPDRYEHRHDWRTGDNGHVELDYNSQASDGVVRASELRFLMSGVTTMASGGGYAPGLVRNIDEAGALEGLNASLARSSTFPLDDIDGTQNDSGCNYGDSPTNGGSIGNLDGYLPHIAEGISLSACNEFVCAEAEFDLIQPQTAVVHGMAVTPEKVDAMREGRSLLVWSPRSNVVLYGDTAPVTVYDHLSVPIALGTDWVPSGSMNFFRELACVDSLNTEYFAGHFNDYEIWKMATLNGAFAVGAEDGIGALKLGYMADISVYRAADGKEDYRTIIAGAEADTVLVMRGGAPLFGDAAVMDALRPGCESLDVCGTAKAACVELDTGETLASTRSAIEEFYPLFFCGVPDDEPSCLPMRPGQYAGTTQFDADGDGIADENDNCPMVFNPARPLEDAQGDADADGYGDACDSCPLTATNDCVPPASGDFDGDGVGNGVDNCPDDANGDQADADSDGHGDACDTCPAANPGPAACVVTIAAVRDPDHPDHPEPGSGVALEGGVVTGIRDDNSGFYLQDPAGGPFSALIVFTGGDADNVAVGDIVRVVGIYEEFFDVTEVTASVFEVSTPGGGLPVMPEVVTAAEVADGGALAETYESVLVSVESVVIVNENPDDPRDYDEFEIDDGLRVDDASFDALDNLCPAGTTFDAITGNLGFSFGHNKLYPRDADDFVNGSCAP